MKLLLQHFCTFIFFVLSIHPCIAQSAVVHVSSTRADSVFVDGIYAGQAPLRVLVPYGVHTFSCGDQWKKALVESSDGYREVELYPTKWSSSATDAQKDIVKTMLAQTEPIHYAGKSPVTLLRTLVSMKAWYLIFNKQPTKEQIKYGDDKYFYDMAVLARSHSDASAFVTRLNELTGIMFALPDSIDLMPIQSKLDYKAITTRPHTSSNGATAYYSAGSNDLKAIQSICANTLLGEYTSENGDCFFFNPLHSNRYERTGAFRLKIQLLRADNEVPLTDLTDTISKARQHEAERNRENFLVALNKAEKGDAEAMAELGSYYHLGIGTNRDNEKAVEWDIKAAKAGTRSAANHLAYYSKWAVSPKLREAVAPSIYRYYAEQGDKFHRAALAECYYLGFGVVNSSKTARKWLKSTEGTTYGEYMLGLLSLIDENDRAKASKHFLNAINNRDGSLLQGKAFYRMGGIAAKNGDEIESTELQKAAYLLNVPEGYIELAERLSLGVGCMRDNATAVAIYYEYYQQALASFDKKGKCAFAIANAYRFGDGVPKNESLSLSWYKKSANLGFAKAHLNLGIYYMSQKTDTLQALQHFSIAAEKNNKDAMDKLISYYKKKGDNETADYWAEKRGTNTQKKEIITEEEAEKAKSEYVRSIFHWEGSEEYLGKNFKEVAARYGRKSAESAVAAFYYSYLNPIYLTDLDQVGILVEWMKIVKEQTPRNSEKYAGIFQWMGSVTGRVLSYAYHICQDDISYIPEYIRKFEVSILTCLELSKMCLEESIEAYTSIGMADSEECITSKSLLAYILFNLSEFKQSSKQLRQALSSLQQLSVNEIASLPQEHRISFCRKWFTQLAVGIGAYTHKSVKNNSGFAEDVFNVALITKGIFSSLQKVQPDLNAIDNIEAVSWRNVQKRLAKDEAAIEVLRSHDEQSGKLLYFAAILRHKGQPSLVKLGYEEDLLTYFHSGLTYTSDLSYTVFWKKLEPFISDCKTVYYSPDGIFYQLQMETVPFDGETYVDEHWNIIRLSSCIELVRSPKTMSLENILLVGGLNYDTGDVSKRRITRGGVNKLPESINEVKNIEAQLKSAGLNTTMLTGNEGNEQTISKAMEHKNLIHIATHGYYWTESEQRLNRSLPFMRKAEGEDMSMLSSGLMVAGVNNTLRNRMNEIDISNDGFLTSEEISKLDIKDASLVVLSACQTGLGNVSSTGVDGLQKALKAAGAQSLLLSLWPIDDYATRLLMEEFYRQLLSGKTKAAALKGAKEYLRNYSEITLEGIGHIKIKPYENPFYWASFVLIDAIE